MDENRLTQEQIDAFLLELTQLSRKHGVGIGGCGCHGSPYLLPVSGNVQYTVRHSIVDRGGVDFEHAYEDLCFSGEDNE